LLYFFHIHSKAIGICTVFFKKYFTQILKAVLKNKDYDYGGRGSVWCGVAQLWCGMAQLVAVGLYECD
jgi:hypothetical protein